MADIIEKLKSIRNMIDECISEYEGEESDEGESEGGEESYSDSSSSKDVGDKIKMAASILKKRMAA